MGELVGFLNCHSIHFYYSMIKAMDIVLSTFRTLFAIDNNNKEDFNVNVLNEDGDAICLKNPSHQLFDGAIIDVRQLNRSNDSNKTEPNKENNELNVKVENIVSE